MIIMSKDTDFLSKRFMVNFIYDFEKNINSNDNINNDCKFNTNNK